MTAWVYALLASLALNGTLGWAWPQAHDTAAATTLERDSARGLASACSDATQDLRDLSDKRAATAAPRQAAARAAAVKQGDRALEILSTPAAVPGDDYASARRRIDGWLKGRAP